MPPFDPTTLLTFAVIIAAGYFLLIRPAKKRQADQQQTMNAITPGTRVMTTAGVFGTVRHVGDKQIVIEISPGVEMTLVKAAIAKVVKPDEDEFEYDDSSADGLDEAGAADGAEDAPEPQAPESPAADGADAPKN